jgi:hypothetical protein
MRSSPIPLILTAWAVTAVARAQSAAPQPEAAPPAVSQPGTEAAAAQARGPKTAARHRPAAKGHERAPPVSTPVRKPTAEGDGVLTLGATDITGNKELPKVMVIVPWKDATGAGGVIKPTDSLMNEVLGPVDRSVFQRRIRYYGQLRSGSQAKPRDAAVAPVGDNR